MRTHNPAPRADRGATGRSSASRTIDPLGLSEIGLVEIAPHLWVPARLADDYRRRFGLDASSPARGTICGNGLLSATGAPAETRARGVSRAETAATAQTVGAARRANPDDRKDTAERQDPRSPTRSRFRTDREGRSNV